MTTFSPYTVGSVDTRRSTATPSTVNVIRPSLGTRRSAMSMSAITFSREITPGMIDLGWRMRCCSTPSIRKRMRRSCLGRLDVDVRCAFLDRLQDDEVDELHDRGFLDDGAQGGQVGVVVRRVVHRDLGDAVDLVVQLAPLLQHLGQLIAGDRDAVKVSANRARRSSTARRSPGFTMPTTRRPFSRRNGTAWYRRPMCSGSTVVSVGSLHSARSEPADTKRSGRARVGESITLRVGRCGPPLARKPPFGPHPTDDLSRRDVADDEGLRAGERPVEARRGQAARG